MTSKTIALGVCFVMSVTALGNKSNHKGKHTVHAGGYTSKAADNDWTIAKKFGIHVSALHEANPNINFHALKGGVHLSIPGSHSTPSIVVASAKSHAGKSSSSVYKTKASDSDWTVARHFNVHVAELRSANPKVNFKHLKGGIVLHIPHSSGSTVTKLASVKVSHTKYATYLAKADDNDWTIARRFDTTPRAIRSLNPDVEWRKLRPKMKITVPGHGGGSEVAEQVRKMKRINSRYAMLVGDNVNVRSGPAADEDKVARVAAGRKVAILDHDGNWYRVRFDGGTKGWVRSDFLMPVKGTVARHHRHHSEDSSEPVASHSSKHHKEAVASRSSRKHHDVVASNDGPYRGSGTRSAILSKANSYRGTPYRYGRASRNGTDCSGFTQQVFGSQGIGLPRTSAEQSHVGKKIDRSSLKPGDLVFFHTVRGTGVSHVGIYVGGNKFIHASSGAGHVKTSSLDEAYYNRRFVGARRVAKLAAGKKKVDRGE